MLAYCHIVTAYGAFVVRNTCASPSMTSQKDDHGGGSAVVAEVMVMSSGNMMLI